MRILFYLLPVMLLSACSKDIPLNGNPQECLISSSKYDTAVLLVMGQSNAANAGETLYFSQCANTSNFHLGEFYPLHDPLKGADGLGGSVWSRMADKLLENQFAQYVVIAPVARGGTFIEQWVPGGNLNYLIPRQVEALSASNLEITHVLWHQGESNNSLLYPTISPEDNALSYKENFHVLTSYLRSIQVDAPIFVAAATRCGDLTVDYALQQAQNDLASDSLGIYNGPNTDLIGPEFRYDDCHFSELGLDIHALMWTEVLLQY